jgi:hypothetical protein
MVLGDLLSDLGWKLLLVAVVAEISLIGIVAAVWGAFRLRRTRFRPQASERLLRELVGWRMLEEDPTGEYPHAEPLVVLWAHRQGFAALLCGGGVQASNGT